MRIWVWLTGGCAALVVLALVSFLVSDSDASAWMKVKLDVPVAVSGAPATSLDVYTPRRGHDRPMLMWIHGGGYIGGNPRQIEDLATSMTRAGFVVASVRYTLAPHARYPTQLRQESAALAYLRAHASQFGGDPSRIFIGGDSAGAQMASQLAAVQTNPLLAADVGLRPVDSDLRGVILYAGLYDMSTVGADPLAHLDEFLSDYTGEQDWNRASQLSTVRWVSRDYPPTFLSDATRDPFYPQSVELAHSLARAGASVDLVSYRGLHHDFQFDVELAAARRSLARTIRFMRAHARPVAPAAHA